MASAKRSKRSGRANCFTPTLSFIFNLFSLSRHVAPPTKRYKKQLSDVRDSVNSFRSHEINAQMSEVFALWLNGLGMIALQFAQKLKKKFFVGGRKDEKFNRWAEPDKGGHKGKIMMDCMELTVNLELENVFRYSKYLWKSFCRFLPCLWRYFCLHDLFAFEIILKTFSSML